MRPTPVPVALGLVMAATLTPTLDAVFQQLIDDTGKLCPSPAQPSTPWVQSRRPALREGASHPIHVSQSWPGRKPQQASVRADENKVEAEVFATAE